MTYHYYQIYGLRLKSSRPIAALAQKPLETADLTILWTTNRHKTPDPTLPWQRMMTPDLQMRGGISFFQATTEEGTFNKICFEDSAKIINFQLAADQKTLWILHDEEALETDLDSYFIGPILGCILRLLGVLCLHASVVNIEGRAVAILGRKRSGKSTTAAAFAQLGYAVLADDMAVITLKNGVFYVESGYAKVRLRPKSLAVLHTQQAESFEMVYEGRDSRYANLGTQFFDSPLPLGAMYLLSDGSEPGALPYIEPFSVLERVVRLNENTFANYVITPNLRKAEFAILNQIIENVPFNRLCINYDLAHLSLQCQAVVADFTEKIKDVVEL